MAYDFLYQIDFIRAKALYAGKIKAGRPIFENRQNINWYDARHPLLEASLKAQRKSIVPLRIELKPEKRILIISGPNAGGKSVCLKTVGLLQYMLQCGLLVPLRETSETGIFTKLYIDIGDEQSLENDLSTYSSHLLNMKRLVEGADERTLFLIDECGSGTDPHVGGAIAEAIIEDLNEKKAFGVITTHYSNLKLLCDKPENHGTIFNGAMLFDLKAMKPLYVLATGKPGSSFAFEIAKQTGLPKQIIERAAAKTGSGLMDFERQLQQLEVDKRELQQREAQFNMADTLLAETFAKYERLNADIENRKAAILHKAKEEAKQILADANQKIEKTIADIRAANAQKEAANIAREQIKQDIEQLERDIKETKNQSKTPKPPKTAPDHINNVPIHFDPSPVREGDYVLLEGSRSFAQVVRVKRNRAEVAFGNKTVSLPLSEIKKVSEKSYRQYNEQKSRSSRSNNRSIMDEINSKRAVFKYQIDIRGQKAEQALTLVAKQIDEARLLGEGEFAVLHGKGDGILKSVIREYLKTCSDVTSFRPATLESGGEGITIVKLN
jgi:DNA mismatch repair protein MutS2